MPALRAAPPGAIFLPARRPMIPLPTIPGAIRTPHSTPKIHGLRSANSGVSVRMAYCDPTPSEAIADQRSIIVGVPARYMELRAVSIVECIVCQLSPGESVLFSPLDSCIVRLLLGNTGLRIASIVCNTNQFTALKRAMQYPCQDFSPRLLQLRLGACTTDTEGGKTIGKDSMLMTM